MRGSGKAGNRSQKSEVGSRKSEVGSRKSEVGSQESGVGSHGTGGDGARSSRPRVARPFTAGSRSDKMLFEKVSLSGRPPLLL
ncbi:hypothetical protein Pan189_13660 [Stratiformator vulcanicus]|uniref:Uncharacterized protein n=1 Tax=Stratiformator vulcanicus TaxID=2527980 RepID=A0A517QZE3_9PLAN|nr:hypothetical protein Pan189_13660 [Stratiformator vulcanicus]